MRQGYAHEAVLVMAPEADLRAPGAAITTALCGHWEHDPPCPLASHHTGAERLGDEVRLSILFATEPHLEESVRHQIELALSHGHLVGSDGTTTRWQLHLSRPRVATPQEADHLERLRRD